MLHDVDREGANDTPVLQNHVQDPANAKRWLNDVWRVRLGTENWGFENNRISAVCEDLISGAGIFPDSFHANEKT